MSSPSPSAEQVRAVAEASGVFLLPGPAAGLARYLSLLVRWNARLNLVGPSDWRAIFETLAMDSLRLAGFLRGLPLPAAPLTLDLGSGAGLPGIPLRLVWEAGDYWLCEVRQKRVAFLRTVLGELLTDVPSPGLGRTHLFHGRAEDLLGHISGCPDRADCIVSRAFLPWPALFSLSRSMLLGDFTADPGFLVVLANEPPPTGAIHAPGWRLAATLEYPAAGRTRWFWALRPEP